MSPPGVLPEGLGCESLACKRYLTSLTEQLDKQKESIKKLLAERRELRKLLKIRQAVPKEPAWKELMQQYHQPQDGKNCSWHQVLAACYAQENMSIDLRYMHPGIRLIAPLNGDERPSTKQPSQTALVQTTYVEYSRPACKTFPFERLLLKTQMRILEAVLHKKGELIHCLSRLDPFPESDSSIGTGLAQRGLQNRFYWGPRYCQMTRDGKQPNEVLAALLVNKRWHYIGVHLFYGLNTFAFSSFGELGRFCDGIKSARVARIQNIELVWKGGGLRGRKPLEDSTRPGLMQARNLALSWLARMPSLRTLVVHVQESDRIVIRRPSESHNLKTLMQEATAGQPNIRMTRRLRSMAGMDWLHCLRGLNYIALYDLDRGLIGDGNSRFVKPTEAEQSALKKFLKLREGCYRLKRNHTDVDLVNGDGDSDSSDDDGDGGDDGRGWGNGGPPDVPGPPDGSTGSHDAERGTRKRNNEAADEGVQKKKRRFDLLGDRGQVVGFAYETDVENGNDNDTIDAGSRVATVASSVVGETDARPQAHESTLFVTPGPEERPWASHSDDTAPEVNPLEETQREPISRSVSEQPKPVQEKLTVEPRAKSDSPGPSTPRPQIFQIPRETVVDGGTREGGQDEESDEVSSEETERTSHQAQHNKEENDGEQPEGKDGPSEPTVIEDDADMDEGDETEENASATREGESDVDSQGGGSLDPN